MHDTNNLRGIDLNLLVVLEALLAEQHVSRTATRLNMSQPAVSHALARLRSLFDDPLLVRRSGKLEPSTRAIALKAELDAALSGLRRIVGPSTFIPETENRTFRLAMSDYGSSIILPALVRWLRINAQGIAVEVVQMDRLDMIHAIREGDVDLALGVFDDLPPRIEQQLLFEEDFACVCDRKTVADGTPLDLEHYLARPHIRVAARPDTGTEIDHALTALGHSRRIIATLPHWGSAPLLVRDTDLVLTIARRSLKVVEDAADMAVEDVPFLVPTFRFEQIWHERRSQEAAHIWLRGVISNIGSGAICV